MPYRRSKLTLLMKDVFHAGCTRLCSTVVLATCSPLASDCAHSANTLTDHSFVEECKDVNGDATTCTDRGIQSSVDLAKDLYLSIWTLMSDAKTRKRRKDGSIITMEDEENERLRIIAATEEKARLWAEREKHLLA